MLELITEPFAFGFMRNALAAGLLTVLAASIVGTWVVMRGLTFITDALAHGVLPGIAIAFVLGGNLAVGAAVSAVVMIGGISLTGAKSRLGEDAAIGLLFVGMLSLGVVIISRRGAYAGDLTTILFGDPLGVTASHLSLAAIACLVTVVVTVVLYRPFLALSFSRAKAQVLGLRPGLAHPVMLALVALVVVTSFRTIGTMLVFAFLVAPPATAALVARRVPVMMAVSVAVGAAGTFAGLLISYHQDTATAATISGLTVATFFVVLAVREVYERLDFLGPRRRGARTGV